MSIIPGDSGVVIGYQTDEFTHTWLVEHFVVQWNIYPGFTGKVSTVNLSPLKPGCEDNYFLDQAVEDFKHGLDTIFTGSVKTLELDVSFDEPYVILSSVSSGFLCLVNNLSDNA